MADKTFRFRITFIWGTEADLWVEIPMELYQRVCDSVGKGKMERFDQEIDKWKSEHYDVDVPDYALHTYGLTSTWFEDGE